MNGIRVRLFGGLGVSRGDTPLPSIPTQKARSLFAYLVLHRGRDVHRDVVCGALWGEHTDAEARKALRSALWRLRTVLEPEEEDRGAFLRVDGDQLGFPGTSDAWVDTAEFEACVSGSPPEDTDELPSGRAELLRRAVSLYQGDLLDGVYEDWCFPDRERFRLAYLTALERLLAHDQARGRWLAAISTGQAILRADPLREHVHRRLMCCHLSMGDRPSALRQFESYDALVRKELDVEPLQETQELYVWIRDHGILPPWEVKGGRHSNGEPGSAPPVLRHEIDDALRSLQQLMARLEATTAAAGPPGEPHR
jgi:DNA-binding SARP family transcriptional activator